jgi:hypothetical protein
MLKLEVCGHCGHLLHRYNRLAAFARFREVAIALIEDPRWSETLFVAAGQQFLLALRKHHAERIQSGVLDVTSAAKPCDCQVRSVDDEF